MINLNTFRPTSNYVLVKVDDNLETYQLKGNETGIVSPDFKYENGKTLRVEERNYSVKGTVYAIPEKLSFKLNEIRALKARFETHKLVGKKLQLVNLSVQREIDSLTKASLLYGTQLEISVGDRVNFSYMAHKEAVDNGLSFDTEEGKMYMIKYDMLNMTLNSEDKPLKMLNGFLLVEPEMMNVKKEGLGNVIERESGIALAVMGHTFKKTRRNQIGSLILSGSRNTGYLQQPDRLDSTDELEKGQTLIYDSRLALRLEYESHQQMSEKVLHLIHRHHIWFKVDKGFDMSTLSLEKRRTA